MPLDPVEFTFQSHKFRHTPLAAFPLAHEVHKLMSRLDRETGALDTLAFTLDETDYAALSERDGPGLAKLVKLFSILVGTSAASAPEPVDEDAPPKPEARDTLPSTVHGLLLYYTVLGKIERARKLEDGEVVWTDCHTEEQLNECALRIAPFVCAFHVLRGIFGPFVEALRDFSAEAKKKRKKEAGALSSSTATNADTDDSAAPTSET